jgi:hypothetical protein
MQTAAAHAQLFDLVDARDDQQGGERRLNVAITRARQQVTLVSSLLPEDIDLKRTQHPGPRLLREYLEYARAGGTGDWGLGTGRPESPSSQSPIPIPRTEDQLAAALAQRGLSLARQIGHSDFRIDIAIRDTRDDRVIRESLTAFETCGDRVRGRGFRSR